MSVAMTVWKEELNVPTARRVDQALLLNGEQSSSSPARSDVPRLIPVRSGRGAVAALLVPGGVLVRRNGVPLPPGAHAVLHADCVQTDDARYWVAAATEIAVSQYEPALHGEGVYCFFTKARLKPGEAIVVCPGRPGAECSVIYKQAAWQMAIQADVQFQCPRCGFDPAAGDWQPELPAPSQLPRLLKLAEQHRERRGA